MATAPSRKPSRKRLQTNTSLPQLQATSTRFEGVKNGLAGSKSLPQMPLLRQQEANTLHTEQKSRTCSGFFVPLPQLQSPLPHLQQQALKQNTIARVAKLANASPAVMPGVWRLETRAGIYTDLERDLEVKTMKESSARWKPTADIAELEAEELKRLEKVNQRRAIQRPVVHLSMWDRKNCQNTALAGDKQYVAQCLSRVSEDEAAKLARTQVLRDKWFQSVFQPMPGHVISKEILQRMPPPTMQAEAEETKSQCVNEHEEEDEDNDEEFIFEQVEITSIINCCRSFFVLGRDSGPEVLTRAAFCRMACAFEGFRSQGRPWLKRSVAHFDRLCSKIVVQSEGTTLEVLGVRMPDVQSLANFGGEVTILVLFRCLLQDMLDDMGWVEAKQTPSRRSSMKRNLRNWFFESLLPSAQDYAHARQEVLKARIGQAKPDSLADVEEDEEAPAAGPEDADDASPVPTIRVLSQDEPRPEEVAPETTLVEPEVEEKPEVEAEAEMTEFPDLHMNEKTELYAHTFVVQKGENLLCQLMEPEVMCLLPQLSDVFFKLFEAYADLPMPDGSGSMSLKGLLRCCSDFELFPDRVDYKTILWIYNFAEGCSEVETPSEQPKSKPPPSPRGREGGSKRPSERRSNKLLTRGSGRMKRSLLKSGSKQMEKGDTSTCILYHGKWIKEHLIWMTKSPHEMSPSELRAIGILTPTSKWMECQCLTAKELLVYFDDDGNGALSADELSTALQFMSFEDPPTKEDIEDVFMKLLPPKAVELDLEIIGMAMTAVSKKEEHSSVAYSVMVKDIAKMNKEQSNAAIFFREMVQYMKATGTNAHDLFVKLDDQKLGALTGREITEGFRCLVTVMGQASPAFEINNAFLLHDPQGLQKFTKADFVKLMAQVRKAERYRAQSKHPHPIFLTTADSAQGSKSKKVFGPVAFMECMVKIGLEYLSYHGNLTQQALPAYQKLVWLFAFLTWSFDSAQQRCAAQQMRPDSEGSRCGSRCSERIGSRQGRQDDRIGSSQSQRLNEERIGSSQRQRVTEERLGSSQRQRLNEERIGSSQRQRLNEERIGSSQRQRLKDERPYPRFLPPLQRLITRHPRLFVDALKEPHDVLVGERPEWAPAQSDLPDVLMQHCTDLLLKEREQKEAYVPFHRVLLKLAAEGQIR